MIDNFEFATCPSCLWQPDQTSIWKCSCDYDWNSFDTGGLCPVCYKQWMITQCINCNTRSKHIDWYNSLLLDGRLDWRKANMIFSNQYINAHKFTEVIEDQSTEQLNGSLDERMDALNELRTLMDLEELDLEGFYNYYLATRPVSIERSSFTGYRKDTERIVQQIKRIQEREQLQAEDYLVAMGLPEYLLGIAGVYDEQIVHRNNILAKDGLSPMTSQQTEQFFLKLFTKQNRLETEHVHDNNLLSEINNKYADDQQYFMQHPENMFTSVSIEAFTNLWTDHFLKYWMNVIDENIINIEQLKKGLHESILKRIESVNRLRRKLGLWLYGPEMMDKYLERNYPAFNFLNQNMEIEDFNELTSLITEKGNENALSRVPETEKFLLAIGQKYLSSNEQKFLQERIIQMNNECVANAKRPLTGLQTEDEIRDYLKVKYGIS